MKAKLFTFNQDKIVPHSKTETVSISQPQLILVFGEKDRISEPSFFEKVSAQYPKSEIVMSSTAGEICDLEVLDGEVIITAFEFEKTEVKSNSINIGDYENSYDAGTELAKKLSTDELCYVLIISDGAIVNGSELIKGIEDVIPNNIPVTGGLAGDGANFRATAVGLNQVPKNGVIAAIGFYGKNLQIGHGSLGGWDVFGPEKIITKAIGNVLYEIENKNALQIYKEYLGKFVDGLPASALLFPLAVMIEDSEEVLVRTILSIDEENQTLTFAGDLPVGSKVRLMKANFDKLINAASSAAQSAFKNNVNTNPDYALLISCVGRKLILKNRIDEEVEAVADIFSDKTIMSGFYSNGELSPLNKGGNCQLHNQTMTITTFTEI